MENINRTNREKLQLKLKLKYLPWFYILDQLIRIAIFLLYLQNYFSTWVFVIFQISLLIIIGILHNKYEIKLEKIFKEYISSGYSNRKIQFSFEDNIPQALLGLQLLLGFIFSFWFSYHIIDNHSWYMYIVIYLLACFGTVILILPLTFTARYSILKGVISFQVNKINLSKKDNNDIITTYTDVTKQHQEILLAEKLNNIIEETIELDSVDYNDTRIARLESELKNINHKVDAWIIESVFLGGLAFSSFLTVAAANFLGKETKVFKEFLNHATEFIEICTNEDYTSWLEQIDKVFFRNDLFILIMLLCLLSSVFFLLVLTLRFRLNSLSLNMDHLIRIMTIFNAKEEELYNLKFEGNIHESQSKRLMIIEKKIDIAISDADKLLKELKPTATMMSIYRNIAVLLFYLVLIISGFYFSPIVSFMIFSLAVFTQVFRLFETYSKLEKIKALIKKH